MTYDIENTNHFVQLCATKFRERSLPLCSCVLLRGDYRSGRVIGTQTVLLILEFRLRRFVL